MLLFLLLLSFAAPATPGAADDAAIYQQILETYGPGNDGDYFVVIDRAATFDGRWLHDDPRGARITVPPPHRAAAASTVMALLKHGAWSEFYRAYPHSRGFIRFGAPEYSRDGGEATVEMEHGCGLLCGHGWHFRLVRDGARWKVSERRERWIS